MHDIAGVVLINATVLITSYTYHRALRRLRDEMLDGIRGISSDVRALDISYREQQQKSS